VVEGAPLLRAYRGKTPIEGSNPSLSARNSGQAAQTWADFCRRFVLQTGGLRRAAATPCRYTACSLLRDIPS
jgi:hypothetical protein